MSEETKETTEKVFTQEEVNALLLKEKGKADEAVIKERDQYKGELDQFKKAADAGLSPGYAKYIKSDEDVEFFKNVSTTPETPVPRFVEKKEPKDAADKWAMEVESDDDD